MTTNQNYLASYNFSKYCAFLKHLKKLKFLTSNYFDDDFLSCAAGLALLQQKSLLNRQNFAFVAHPVVAQLIIHLNARGALNMRALEFTVKHQSWLYELYIYIAFSSIILGMKLCSSMKRSVGCSLHIAGRCVWRGVFL